jgi:GNAT superfamily N-acetyltransferase
VIRLARPDDLPALIDVEIEAGSLFRDVDMAAIADDDRDRPVAYLVAEVVDGHAHVEQVSVRPSHARRGLGSALIETLAEWARERGLAALTLTTFSAVPWNAPYYERLRFHVLEEAEIGAGLREIRRAEAARGLDAWPRVAMIRSL